MYVYFEYVLIVFDFFDLCNLKKLMLWLWWLFVCMGFECEEVNILCGVVKYILLKLGKLGGDV